MPHDNPNDFVYALLIVGSLACFSIFISDGSKNPLEVLLNLVKLIPMTIIVISSLLSRLVFMFVLQFLALIINLLQIPTHTLQAGLQLLAESIRSLIAYLLQLAMEVVSTMVSTTIDLLNETVSKFGEVFVEAIQGLPEKGKEEMEALREVLTEVVGSTFEMGAQVISDLWSNFMEVLTSVIEKEE
ncbi:hypothetical protein MLD38_031695 [Melastoma candidum]|uniref:Uncharacterized protein n=1 Tax=Melastoma candidum TaxID=119954 RepID=A0ACB9MRM5_9MYRT|nr:hypothetical protein MLD38_031695 [Melastoma candidum]